MRENVFPYSIPMAVQLISEGISLTLQLSLNIRSFPYSDEETEVLRD